jgi:hypothetical protein
MKINSQHHNLLGNQIGRFLYFGGYFGFKMAAIANQMMDINSQHHNLLGNQISSKSEDFLYFGGHFGFKMAAIAKQNGRHMVQHVLLPVNIHFH